MATTATPTTAGGWDSILADLSRRRKEAEGHISSLRLRKSALSLEAALGSVEAKRELTKINTELTRASFEMDDLEQAVLRAQERKRDTAQAEAAEAERQRQSQVGAHMRAYMEHVAEIDRAMCILVERFAAARTALDAAHDLMTPDELRPAQQLRSLGPATRAAVYWGLGAHLSLERGILESHKQSLSNFTRPYVEEWVGRATE